MACRICQTQGSAFQASWKQSASFGSGAIENTIRLASAAFIHLSDLNPGAFAAALGVEETAATTLALRRLQAIDAATETLQELATKASKTDKETNMKELLELCSTRIKQRLEVSQGLHAMQTELEGFFFWRTRKFIYRRWAS